MFRNNCLFKRRLHNLEQQPLLGHLGDLLVELEPVHDVADVLREPVDEADEVLGHLEIGVGPLDGPGERQLRQVIERSPGDGPQFVLDDRFGLAGQFGVSGDDLFVGRFQQTVEPA